MLLNYYIDCINKLVNAECELAGCVCLLCRVEVVLSVEPSDIETNVCELNLAMRKM